MRISLGHDNHHALPRACQQHAISVFDVALTRCFVDALPAAADEFAMKPARLAISEVSVPDHASPVELKALHQEFGADVLQMVGGTDVLLVVQEPMDGIDLGAHVDSVWLEGLGLGGGDDAVALLSAGALAQPLLGLRVSTMG